MSDKGLSNPSVGPAFVAEARRRLAASHQSIKHCLGQLDEIQVWWRPNDSMNSIANLVLHLCGNLRQWLVSGIGGAKDERDRPREFAEREFIPPDELLQRLATTVAEADATLSRVAEASLVDGCRIQGFDETVLSAVFSCLTHLAGHAQEIIYITRLQLGDAYVFAWQPATPEQGAVSETEVPGGETVASRDAVFEEMPAHPLHAKEPVGMVPQFPVVATDDPSSAEPKGDPHHQSPLNDYLLDLEQEFQEEQEEGKL